MTTEHEVVAAVATDGIKLGDRERYSSQAEAPKSRKQVNNVEQDISEPVNDMGVD